MKIKSALAIAAAAGLIGSGGVGLDGINLNAIGDKISSVVGSPEISRMLDFGGTGRGQNNTGWYSSTDRDQGEFRTYTVKTDPNEKIIGPYLDAGTRTINLFGDTEKTYYVDVVGGLGGN